MKKTLSFRILSLLFALVFLVTALPLGIFANDTETTEEAAAANEELTATVSEGGSLLPTGYEPEPSFVTEVTELRTENVKHFDNGDGTYEAVSYGTAVHRKDVDGKWQDIDNTLTLREDRGVERYVSSDARISFAPVTSGDGAIWSLSENGYSVSLSLSEADLRAGAGADVRNHATRAEQVAAAKKADDREAVLRVDNSTSIVYRNVLANVDLEYILSGNDVKETILVQNVCENYDYSFKLSLSWLIPKETEDGAILLCDAESGEEIYLLPAPYMTDANDEYSDAVSYRLTDLGEGEYEIIISASDEWINAPERAFPVAIDPTMASPVSYTADTYVNSATNYINQNNGDKQFAWISDEKTTLIRSFSMPELPPGATIINGRLKFAYYFADGATTGSMTITAHRATRDWAEKGTYGVTWNSLSQNGTDPTLGLTSAIYGAELMAVSSYPQWAEISITSIVQFWYDGSNIAGTYNYGIGLKRSSGKTLVNLRTKEYNSGAYAPYFTVSYRLFDGVYSIRRAGSNYYLGTEARYVTAPVIQWSISSPPNTEELRSYLYKIIRIPNTDDFVIRSMQNNQFYLYRSGNTVQVGGYTVNGEQVSDANLPETYKWKIGNAPGGYDNRIWNVDSNTNTCYFLRSSANGNGVTTTLTTSAANDWTEWEFCKYTGSRFYNVISFDSSFNIMVPNESKDFDHYMYDSVINNVGPVSYSVTDLNGNPTGVATVNSVTGVCTANSVGSFRLCVTYPNAIDPWIYVITVSKLPCSGYEIPFSPDDWNNTNALYYSNCYNYALNIYNTAPDGDYCFMQPGELAGLHSSIFEYLGMWENTSIPVCYRRLYSASTIVSNASADATELGITFSVITNRFEVCPEGTYKIALVVDSDNDPNIADILYYDSENECYVIQPDTDYHWYRQNPDGTWSHKLGVGEVTNLDASGNIIYDPQVCNRDYRNTLGVIYSDFVGYYCVSCPDLD